MLLGTCCSVVLDCSLLASRGALFVVILLLLSDPDDLGCSALFSFALSSLVATSPPMSSLLLVRVASWVGSVFSSPVTSLVPVFGSLLAVSLGRAPETDDPPVGSLECVVASSVLCATQFSSGPLTRDDRQR